MPRDPRRDSLYLADIVEASRAVQRWLDEHGDRWEQDEILRNAVLRQLMVIGEAAAALDDDLRVRLPDVPWHEIRGFRNHAVHAYFALDWALVWEIADANLPELERQVLGLLAEDYPDLAEALDAQPSGNHPVVTRDEDDTGRGTTL